MDKIKAALRALRARLSGIDPKVITTTATTIVTAAVVRLGLELDDPIVASLVPIVVGAVVGYFTPNAASGLDDRWTPTLPDETATAEDVVLVEPSGPERALNEVPPHVDEARAAAIAGAKVLAGVNVDELE
jgi:hypothetical protein